MVKNRGQGRGIRGKSGKNRVKDVVVSLRLWNLSHSIKTLRLIMVIGLTQISLMGLASNINASSTPSAGIANVQVSPVGNTGAAMTSIPIEVPPGRKGMSPEISLNYNSRNGNGWVGVGWNLDMGFIQRSTKQGVDYTADDYTVFVNGSATELVRRGSWDEPGYLGFGAKLEGEFTKYLYEKSSNGGWVVTTKDGTKYYYGTIPASRQDDPYNANRIFKWCLDKVKDTNGNYMTITYWKDYPGNGEIYLNRIDYTLHNSYSSAANYVKFHREARTDAPVMFTTNEPVRTAYRIMTIEVRARNNLVRAYKLQYDVDPETGGDQYSTKTGQSLLTSVRQFGTDAQLDPSTGEVLSGTSLPPISLEWYSTTNTFKDKSRHYSNIYSYAHKALADVTGEGMVDAVFWDGNGSLYVVPSNGTKFDRNNAVPHNKPVYAYSGSSFADVTGDGRADAIFWDGSGNLYVVPSNGTGFDYGDHAYHSNPIYAYSEGTFADVTGDGRADAIFWDGSGNLYVVPSNGTGFDYGDHAYHSNPIYAYSESTFADVTGDGRADAIFWNGSGNLYVVPSNGTGFDYGNHTYHNDSIYAYPKGKFADVNGDGNVDAIFNDFSTGDLYILLSDGSGFDYERRVHHSGQPFVGNYNDLFYSDVNGDGRADALLVNLNQLTYAEVYPSNGERFDDSLYDLIPWSVLNDETTWPYFADATGDGKTDMIFMGGSISTEVSIYPSYSNVPDLLKKITNNLGASTTLAYTPSSAYQSHELPSVLQVLSEVEVFAHWFTGWSRTNYNYTNGFFDYDEREFRGFEYVIVTAPDGTETETKFFQDEILKGLPEWQMTTNSDMLYTRAENIYEAVPVYDVYWPRLRIKEDYVCDGTCGDTNYKQLALIARTDFTYDNYGNIERTYYYGDVSIAGDEREEVTHYDPYDTTKWILSLPKTTFVVDADGHIAAQKWFTYSPAGNLQSEETWNDQGPNPVTIYEEYDSYGNPTKIRDPKGYLTNIIYEYLPDYLEVKTENTLAHTALRNIKKYDYRSGKIKEEIDQNNHSTKYEYDKLGRIEFVIGPKDSLSYPTVQYEYLDFGIQSLQRIKIHKLEEHNTDNYIWSELYFNGLGKKIKTKSEGPSAASIVTETKYNSRGLAHSESLPAFAIGSLFTLYEHDPVGRLVKKTYPDNTSATTTYIMGTEETIDANGHLKVKVKDAYGRVVEVQEYTGNEASGFALYATTVYGYDALGNMEYMRDARGNEMSIVYDSLSRKIAISDPDMGLWEYEYDLNGNLITQIDQKDQVIYFQYDELNRIKKKMYPDNNSVDYEYDRYDNGTATNAIGRLTKLTDLTGTTDFYYDELGNTIRTDKTIESIPYSTHTTYNALGRTDTMTYPDGSTIKYEYDSAGNIAKIKSLPDGYEYANFSYYNASGQVQIMTYGNEVRTQYYYDPFTLRLDRLEVSNNFRGLGTFMNKEYEYDNKGIITRIDDWYDSTKTIDYAYDDLDRLIEAKNQDHYGGRIIYQYDTTGNITYNCRYGHYNYEDDDHVHAATRVNRSDGSLVARYQYDGNGNMISGAGRTLTYDYDNRPTSITANNNTTVSIYDVNGKRVKKMFITPTVNSTTIHVNPMYECTDGQCTKYVFAGSQRIAKIDSTDIYYYHSDHLGSSTVITNDSTGSIEQELFYYPYGEWHTNSGSEVAKHKFTGHEYDGETGLYYMGARYYDPKLARFVSADTIVPHLFFPQSLNRYSYAYNNPVVIKDANGHFGFLAAIIVGALIGGSVAAIQGGDSGDILQGAILGAFGGVVGGLAGGIGYAVGSEVMMAASSAGYGATVGAVVGGAVAGATAGGAIAAINGSSIGQGMLVGAVSGGIGGFMGTYSFGNGLADGLAQVGASAVTGGIASEISGGEFWKGAKIGAISASAFALYKAADFFKKNMKFGVMSGRKANVDSNVLFAENTYTETVTDIGLSAVPNQAGMSNPFPRLPSFSESFPKYKFVAPLADIIVGGIEVGGALAAGIGGVVMLSQPELWPIAIPLLPGSVAAGHDGVGRILMGIDALSKYRN